jgi:hypothetical protein
MAFSRTSLSAAVLAIIATGMAGCGEIQVTSTRLPIRPGSVPLPHVTLPPGQWTATGTVLAATNSADEPTGTVLQERPWTFKQVCNPSCHTLFLRQTL